MFRSIAEFEETAQPLSQAEQALIAACRKGEPCTIGEGTLPPEGNTDKALQIRASLLRLLILGGKPDCGLHDSGVELLGAHITETLDLRFAKCRGQLALDSCRFVEKPFLEQARLDQLSLDGSHLPGLFAQGVKIEGNVFFRRATTSGTVDVAGAEIGGQLECDGADFDGSGEMALNAQGMRVLGGFIFRDLESVTGLVSFAAAHVSVLVDDPQSWQLCQDGLLLDGLTYDRITGDASPKTFAGRNDWLVNGSTLYGEFRPQPYTQLAKVFRAAGDIGEARKVLMERDRLLFEHALKPKREAIAAAHQANGQYPIDAWLLYQSMRAWGWLTRVVVGYGHAPQRALGLACWALLIGFLWFMLAWRGGIMVPNSAVILTSADWLTAMGTNPAAPAHDWALLPSGQHYETFYALAYALDVFVPLVSIGQESAWAATTADWFGWGTRIFTIAFQIAGWVITSLGIAAVTGFVQRGGPD